MDTATLTNVVVLAILNRRKVEIEYESPMTGERKTLVVAPFDIGTSDPNLKELFKDNLYAFCEDHVNPKDGRTEPKVMVFAIGKIHSARLLDSSFDPQHLYESGLLNGDIDWGNHPFNLVPDRPWFAPKVGKPI